MCESQFLFTGFYKIPLRGMRKVLEKQYNFHKSRCDRTPLHPSDEGGGFCEAKDGGREISPPVAFRKSNVIAIAMLFRFASLPSSEGAKAFFVNGIGKGKATEQVGGFSLY